MPRCCLEWMCTQSLKPWTCVHLYHKCCVAQSEQYAGHMENHPHLSKWHTAALVSQMLCGSVRTICWAHGKPSPPIKMAHCSPCPTCQAPWRGAETSPPQPLLWPTPALSPEPLLLMPALPPAVPAGGALAVGTAPAVETTSWLICPPSSSQLAKGAWHTRKSQYVHNKCHALVAWLPIWHLQGKQPEQLQHLDG